MAIRTAPTGPPSVALLPASVEAHRDRVAPQNAPASPLSPRVTPHSAPITPQLTPRAAAAIRTAARRRRRRSWTISALVAVAFLGVGASLAWALGAAPRTGAQVASLAVEPVAAPVAAAESLPGDKCRTLDRTGNSRFDDSKLPLSDFHPGAFATDAGGNVVDYDNPLGITALFGDGLVGSWDNCSTKHLSWNGKVYNTGEQPFVGQRILSPGDWIQRTLYVENKRCSGDVTLYVDLDHYLATDDYAAATDSTTWGGVEPPSLGAWQDGFDRRTDAEPQGLDLPEHVELMWGLGGVDTCLAPWQADPLLSEPASFWSSTKGPLVENHSGLRNVSDRTAAGMAGDEAAGQWPLVAKTLLAEPASAPGAPTTLRCSSFLQPLADEALDLAAAGALVPPELAPFEPSIGGALVPIAQAYVPQDGVLPITMGERMDAALDHHHEISERSILAFDVFLGLDCDDLGLPQTGGSGTAWLWALAAAVAALGLALVLRRRRRPGDLDALLAAQLRGVGGGVDGAGVGSGR